MTGSFCVALALGGLVLIQFGTGPRGLFIALRMTARWSFLLFWVAYVAGPSRALLGDHLGLPAPDARSFGLSFASAHLVHLGLVAWLYAVSPAAPVPQSSLVFFSIGAAWTYLLAVLSTPAMSRVLGRATTRVLFQLGMHYVALAFLVDFARRTDRHDLATQLAYLPFIAMSIIGVGLQAARIVLLGWRSMATLGSSGGQANQRP